VWMSPLMKIASDSLVTSSANAQTQTIKIAGKRKAKNWSGFINLWLPGPRAIRGRS
jgi:hypothetical protein